MTIFTGNTVEEAVERGLKRLDVNRENVHIYVEQKEKKGFLGFGKKRARVSIEPIQEETVRKADRLAERGIDVEEVNLGVPKAQSAMEATLELSQVVKAVKAAEKEAEGELSAEERDQLIEEAKQQIADGTLEVPTPEEARAIVPEENLAQDAPEVSGPEMAETGLSLDAEDIASKRISSYLTSITAGMGVPSKAEVKKERDILVFNLTSDQDALLIGKHGKILQSLQLIAKAYANSISDQHLNVAVNVGDYHEKRKAYINSLAYRAAERARQGETVYINDLQSNERKAIHSLLARETGVKSHSEGQEYNRYIVVTKEI
ncbi:RNA-binding cell elongation regulator Jag/EloR [Lactococcus termiticola]|uniref:RNA-binding protein KhpB n=1 Tax=Lactococcus termiticola TaxID=2169526 RepID=A0A2R5HHJ9_9LACT|nr:RNA-binding cell elongation regulator Jag/EloR [Lactococcus termiticola]GBG96825.1 hypothetical protein NtB2_00950 [Lactococcus termiticola]